MANWIKHLTRRRLVVHLASGASLRGVLAGEYSDCLVLTFAEALQGAGGSVPVDGQAVVPRAQIVWIQDLGTVQS